jgi:hypothetical protein
LSSPEATLKGKYLPFLLDIRTVVEGKTSRFRFSRPYYIDEEYTWEIYVSERRKPAQTQQKLEASA